MRRLVRSHRPAPDVLHARASRHLPQPPDGTRPGLTPLSIADRITRGGSRGDKITGRAARGDAQKLMDRWAADDREAGRMSMTEYVRRRKALGYELP